MTRRVEVDELAVDAVVSGTWMPLRPRERRLVIERLTARGKSEGEIARRLGVSIRAVQRHRAKIRELAS